MNKIPAYLHVLPDPSQSTITLISTSPLCSYELNPENFFDAQATGLRSTGIIPDKFPADEAHIAGFARTPEGKGVAVVRQGGGGETWSLAAGPNLSRSASWSAADQVVVLDQGARVDP